MDIRKTRRKESLRRRYVKKYQSWLSKEQEIIDDYIESNVSIEREKSIVIEKLTTLLNLLDNSVRLYCHRQYESNFTKEEDEFPSLMDVLPTDGKRQDIVELLSRVIFSIERDESVLKDLVVLKYLIVGTSYNTLYGKAKLTNSLMENEYIDNIIKDWDVRNTRWCDNYLSYITFNNRLPIDKYRHSTIRSQVLVTMDLLRGINRRVLSEDGDADTLDVKDIFGLFSVGGFSKVEAQSISIELANRMTHGYFIRDNKDLGCHLTYLDNVNCLIRHIVKDLLGQKGLDVLDRRINYNYEPVPFNAPISRSPDPNTLPTSIFTNDTKVIIPEVECELDLLDAKDDRMMDLDVWFKSLIDTPMQVRNHSWKPTYEQIRCLEIRVSLRGGMKIYPFGIPDAYGKWAKDVPMIRIERLILRLKREREKRLEVYNSIKERIENAKTIREVKDVRFTNQIERPLNSDGSVSVHKDELSDLNPGGLDVEVANELSTALIRMGARDPKNTSIYLEPPEVGVNVTVNTKTEIF